MLSEVLNFAFICVNLRFLGRLGEDSDFAELRKKREFVLLVKFEHLKTDPVSTG
jgi:hypothetical protein